MKKSEKKGQNKTIQKNTLSSKKQKNQEQDNHMDWQGEKIQKVKKEVVTKKRATKHSIEYKIDNVVPE